MKIIKLIIFLILLCLTSCNEKSPIKLKGGYAITTKGDTIEFYGGSLRNEIFTKRDIKDIITK